MDTTVYKHDNEVIIGLNGRLDTATAAQVNNDIDKGLAPLGHISQLTCDAARLEYISSSGLRILLSLNKRYPHFRVINTLPQVYEVLETTGFSKIMTVERGLRRFSVKDCEIIGAGGVGTVYRLDGDTIIKVFREGTTYDEVRTEITMAKEAFVLGMPTPISFDVVKVEPLTEGGEECFGLVYELLRAETLSKVIRNHPENMDTYARQYADLLRQLHEIEVPAGSNVPSALDREKEQVQHIARYFPQEDIDLMLRILDYIPQGNRLLHMDLQTKNAMIQDGELMLIDMGEVGYGHPLLDIGDYEQIIGMPRQLGRELWEKAINYYFDGLSADDIALRKAQVEVVSCLRNVSWLSLSDSFPEAIVKECREVFNQRVKSRIDYIMDVCKTFNKWEL